MFVDKLFTYLTCACLKKSHFCMTTKILVDFQICVSVPLMLSFNCNNYIEEISIKSDPKKMKYYQISTINIALCYC